MHSLLSIARRISHVPKYGGNGSRHFTTTAAATTTVNQMLQKKLQTIQRHRDCFKLGSSENWSVTFEAASDPDSAAVETRDETTGQLIRGADHLNPPVNQLAWTLTFDQLVPQIDIAAAALYTQGYRPGDAVVAWLPSNAESTLLHLAAARAGLVLVSLTDASYTGEQLSQVFNRFRPRGVFVSPELRTLEAIETIIPEFDNRQPGFDTFNTVTFGCKEFPFLKYLYVTGAKPVTGCYSWRNSFADGLQLLATHDVFAVADARVKPDEISTVFVNSALGMKAHSHRSLASHAAALAQVTKWQAGAHVCITQPLSTYFGLVSLYAAFHADAIATIPSERFHADAIQRVLEAYACTHITGTSGELDKINALITRSHANVVVAIAGSASSSKLTVVTGDSTLGPATNLPAVALPDVAAFKAQPPRAGDAFTTKVFSALQSKVAKYPVERHSAAYLRFAADALHDAKQ